MLEPVEEFRIITGVMGSSSSFGANGCFEVPSVFDKRTLAVIISDELGWEHVSVHAFKKKKKFIPRWVEMCQIKDMFWEPDDVVVQYHPAHKDYVNVNSYVLHLWRKVGEDFETPPIEMI